MSAKSLVTLQVDWNGDPSKEALISALEEALGAQPGGAVLKGLFIHTEQAGDRLEPVVDKLRTEYERKIVRQLPAPFPRNGFMPLGVDAAMCRECGDLVGPGEAHSHCPNCGELAGCGKYAHVSEGIWSCSSTAREALDKHKVCPECGAQKLSEAGTIVSGGALTICPNTFHTEGVHGR
jgi:RNA polymerase subunit RPABC4/transcription elongation factor Spt4